MKPCWMFVIIFSLFIITGNIISQDSINQKQDTVIINIADDSVNNRQDTKSDEYERIYFKQEKKNIDAIFLSLASGYAKIISDDKYNSLWIHEVSAGIIFNNHWVLGVKYEFWFSSYTGYITPGTAIDIKYTGSGFNITGGYKGSFLRNKFSAAVGLGFGAFIVDKGNYMSMIVFSEFSYYPVNYLSIDLKGSVKLIGAGFSPAGGGPRGLLMPCIKLGATYYFQL